MSITLAGRIAWTLNYIKGGTQHTWESLGKELGSNKDTIAGYAKEKGLIKGEVLEKLVSLFGFSSKWLLEGSGEPFPGARNQYPDVCGDYDPTPGINANAREARDAKGMWGETHHQEVEGKKFSVTTYGPEQAEIPNETISLGKTVDQLSRILGSGNQILIRAIVSNLEAFSQAADQQQRDSARIAKLESECHEFQARLNALEEALLEHKEANHKRGRAA